MKEAIKLSKTQLLQKIADRNPDQVRRAELQARAQAIYPLASDPNRLGFNDPAVDVIKKFAWIVGKKVGQETEEKIKSNPMPFVDQAMERVELKAQASGDNQFATRMRAYRGHLRERMTEFKARIGIKAQQNYEGDVVEAIRDENISYYFTGYESTEKSEITAFAKELGITFPEDLDYLKERVLYKEPLEELETSIPGIKGMLCGMEASPSLLSSIGDKLSDYHFGLHLRFDDLALQKIYDSPDLPILS